MYLALKHFHITCVVLSGVGFALRGGWALAGSPLARASEAGNNRIVLGVHYALDIVGGRISGEVALASRWSDARFRKEVLNPARKELADRLRDARLPVCDIAELHETAVKMTGKPLPFEHGEKVVGTVEYRDGTIVDKIYATK